MGSRLTVDHYSLLYLPPPAALHLPYRARHPLGAAPPRLALSRQLRLINNQPPSLSKCLRCTRGDAGYMILVPRCR